MRESEMYEPVRQFLKRRLESSNAPYYCDECVTREGYRADLVIVQSRRDCVHVVELKAAITEPDEAIDQLLGYPGNHHWLAVSDDLYEAWPGLFSACADAGVGLLVVGGTYRHWVVLKLKPHREYGDFLDEYPRIEQAWTEGC